MKRIVTAVLLVASVGAGAGAYYSNRTPAAPDIVTVPASRGDVVDAVAASGTLQALTTVQVGTQVSGTVAWLGADFNERVTKGQVIARLDPALFDAQVQQAEATAQRVEADADNARVHLADVRQKLDRTSELAARQLVAQSDLDAARTAVDAAAAQVRSADAQLTQARAALNQSRLNRSHAVITAPIDGIVITRNVDIGQTVAASLQSPTIFEIAADLTKMQVSVSIDESDIGRIAPGQRVSFRVDAYPDRTFTGTMAQVRLQPTVVQNVTTYSAIVDVPNPDLLLKPGMTATVSVEIDRRDDVLRVPAAALRFTPSADVLAALQQPAAEGPVRGQPRVWTYANGTLQPVAVTLGLRDSQFAEVTAGSIDAGAAVVTAARTGAQSVRSASASPFMPGGFGPQIGGAPGGTPGARQGGSGAAAGRTR